MRMLSNADLAQLLDKDIFHKISEAADSLHLETYVVGGYVRDLFLERPSNDIDVVVVVGSGIEVAKAFRNGSMVRPLVCIQELRYGAGQVAWS
jgi:poly(A) polymerase